MPFVVLPPRTLHVHFVYSPRQNKLQVPFIPKVKVVRPGSVSVTLEWREPRDNGEQITSYDVQICDAVQVRSKRPCTFVPSCKTLYLLVRPCTLHAPCAPSVAIPIAAC